jgi:hypothetical protein
MRNGVARAPTAPLTRDAVSSSQTSFAGALTSEMRTLLTIGFAYSVLKDAATLVEREERRSPLCSRA